jgi:uncharacterized membrane protein YhaH (DUF805 family)
MPLNDQLKMGFAAVRDSFRFSGRSTRTELVCYLVLCLVALGALLLLVTLLAWLQLVPQGRAGEWLDLVLETTPTIPLLGLLARRLNDQDRSRWFLLAWPLAIMAVFVDEAAEEKFSLLGLSSAGLDVLGDLLFAPAALLLALRGTEGPTRHGPNPREALVATRA